MTTLRCMTYNIRLGIQQGLESITEVIRKESPDVLALQEVGDHWAMGPEGDCTAQIAAATGFEHAHHVRAIEEDGAHFYGHALLSRYPFEVLQEVALAQEVDEPRVLLHTRLTLPGGGGPLHLLSTHLSWVEDRAPQGRALLDEVDALLAQGERVVVMGDLNEADCSTSWLAGLCERLQDADAKEARWTFPSTAPKVRIDYLMSSHGAWRGVRVVEERGASDHLPVVATLIV